MAVHKFTVKDNKVSKKSVEDAGDKPKAKIKAAKTKPASKKTESKTAPVVDSDKKPNVLRRTIEYFKGAWYELRQVRWPNRRQTWELTLAVILFSILLGATIFGLDTLFTWLFTKVIL